MKYASILLVALALFATRAQGGEPLTFEFTKDLELTPNKTLQQAKITTTFKTLEQGHCDVTVLTPASSEAKIRKGRKLLVNPESSSAETFDLVDPVTKQAAAQIKCNPRFDKGTAATLKSTLGVEILDGMRKFEVGYKPNELSQPAQSGEGSEKFEQTIFQRDLPSEEGVSI